MNNSIYINLPVADLEKSKAFFGALGYTFNPQFSDDNAACMILKEGSIYVMLLTRDYFASFAKLPVADAHKATGLMLAVEVESREAVEAQVAKAAAAGGKVLKEADDMGFMYNRSFADLDGHVWEVVHLDMSQFPAQG